MKDILALQQINIVQLFVDLIVIMVATSTVVNTVGKFSEIVGKPFRWVKKKNEDHELLIDLSQRLTEVAERHERDMLRSDKNDEEIKKSLDDFIKIASERNLQIKEELTESISKIEKTISKVYEDNTKYREVSRDIREEMDGKIQGIINANNGRDELINAIANGNKELLGDKIDQKFEKYVKLNGIPENEVDEFESLCQAYFALKGNHNRKTRYQYVKNNLQILPVETNLITG